jgi:lysyl-tRNA synthetase class I
MANKPNLTNNNQKRLWAKREYAIRWIQANRPDVYATILEEVDKLYRKKHDRRLPKLPKNLADLKG